jgi:hypothetical protein
MVEVPIDAAENYLWALKDGMLVALRGEVGDVEPCVNSRGQPWMTFVCMAAGVRADCVIFPKVLQAVRAEGFVQGLGVSLLARVSVRPSHLLLHVLSIESVQRPRR